VRERECLQLCPIFFLSLSGIVVVAVCSRGVTTTMLAEVLQQNEELPTSNETHHLLFSAKNLEEEIEARLLSKPLWA
jgi:hypothetical protein